MPVEPEEFAWKEPEPPKDARETHATFARYRTLLRSSPGRWARIRTYKKPKDAQSTRYILSRADTWEHFEMTARGCELYARYVGPNNEFGGNDDDQ